MEHKIYEVLKNDWARSRDGDVSYFLPKGTTLAYMGRDDEINKYLVFVKSRPTHQNASLVPAGEFCWLDAPPSKWEEEAERDREIKKVHRDAFCRVIARGGR